MPNTKLHLVRLPDERQVVPWARQLTHDLERAIVALANDINALGIAPTTAQYVTMALDASLTDERVLTGTAGEIQVADGGAGGNATLSLIATGVGAGGPTGNATTVPVITYDAKGRLTAVSTATIVGPFPPSGAAGGDLTGTYPNPTIADADLIAIRDLASTAGMLSRTGAGAFAARTLVAPAAGLTIADPTGAAADPTFTLANDLAALEGLGSTGIACRTAADTWAQRSVIDAGSGRIGVTNPAGVGGDITLDVNGAALTKVDDTNVTLTLGGSAATALVNAASLTLGWTGQLSVARGGSGVAAAAANTVFAGPTSGGAAAPAFRALVHDDIDELIALADLTDVTGVTGSGTLVALGTSPTFTTDITTPLIYGGTGASGTLSLQSTSNATRGQINAVDEISLRTSLAAISGAGTIVTAARHTGTLAMNGTLARFSVILNDGTITNAGADLIFLFNQNGTIDRVTSAGTINPVTFNNQPLIRANGGNVTGGVSVGLQHLPRFDQAGGSTLSGMVDEGVQAGMNVVAGTVATRRGIHVNEATGAGTLTDQIAIDIEALTKGAGLNLSLRSIGTSVQMRHAGPAKFGANSAPDTTNGNIAEIERTHTLSGNIGDGQAAGLVLDPGYTGAFTVTRHNYVKLERPSLAASAALTDACVGWFDAAAGTHEAVAAHTGAGTPTLGTGNAPVTGDPDAWIKWNVNGVVMMTPAWI